MAGAAASPQARAAAAVLVVAALVTGSIAASPAAAESPIRVAEELAIDGVYVAPGRSDQVDEPAIAESIRQARALGLRLVVVAPADPQPDAAAFARRVLEASDADAALVFPEEGGMEAHVIDELESASLRARAAGRSRANPVAAVDAFTDELLAEPARELPPIIGRIVMAVMALALVLGGAVIIEQLLRRVLRRPRREPVESLRR